MSTALPPSTRVKSEGCRRWRGGGVRRAFHFGRCHLATHLQPFGFTERIQGLALCRENTLDKVPVTLCGSRALGVAVDPPASAWA